MSGGFARPGRPASTAAVHGTVRLYQRGCRCRLCGHAYSNEQKEARARLKAHRGDYCVSAELAREHIKRLSRAGVGYRAVGEYTAIQPQVISQIKSGKKARIRESTERRILRVQPDMQTDHATVPADETMRLIGEMNRRGITKGRIALMLGYKHPQLQLTPGRVLARTAARVRKIHQKLIVQRDECMAKQMMELSAKLRRVA